MADLIKVTFKDGTTDIVTTDEAIQYRKDGLLEIPESDGKSLTLDEMYGDEYGTS